MLTRRLLPLAAALVVVFGSPATAVAAPPVGECPPGQTGCYVHDDDPGDPGDSGGNTGGNNGRGERTCTRGREPIRCYDPVFGWFNQSDECYYRLAEPQFPPPAGGGSEGGWYIATCLAGVAQPVWFDAPPIAAPPDPETLAREALAGIDLLGADIEIKPDQGPGLVGLPVWLWAGKSENTWGPIQNSATDQGLTVTITARVTRLSFDVGDGSAPVVCADGGTPYAKGAAGPSPDCGHVYARSSQKQPGKKFTITATSAWTVDWASSSGESGTIGPEIRTSDATVQIDELQVVTE